MDRLSLITWNVRYFSHGLKGLRATSGGIERAARALSRARPHLVALPEVAQTRLRGGVRTPQLARLLHALHRAADRDGHGMRWDALYYPAHHYRLPRGPALTTAGLVTLVARPLQVVDHNATAPDDITHVRLPRLARYKQRRIAAWVRVRTPSGVELDLVNTHLSLPAFLESGPDLPRHMGHGSNQLHEAHALLEAIDRRCDGPTVVVGDLNSAPDSPVLDVLCSRGLTDAFSQTVGLEAPGRVTARFAHRTMHIDHVLATPDVRWHGFEPAHGPDDPFLGLSDHHPKWGHLAVGGVAEP